MINIPAQTNMSTNYKVTDDEKSEEDKALKEKLNDASAEKNNKIQPPRALPDNNIVDIDA